MHRRSFLGYVAGGTIGLAGCTRGGEQESSGEPTPGTDGTDRSERASAATTDKTDTSPTATTMRPEDCPSRSGLDVEWPTELNETTVESFVEAYEHAYYRDRVVEYEPESRLDAYELSGGVTAGPRRRGEGWELTYAGNGGIYRPTLLLGARTTEAPQGTDAIPVADVDDDALTGMLNEAAETGEAEFIVDDPGEQVDRYVELVSSLSDEFDAVSGPGDKATAPVDVNGTSVALTVSASNFHGDYEWRVQYYVDERVVRRTSDEEADPRSGRLLACRRAE